MGKRFSRRDFIKLTTAFSAGLMGEPYLKLFPSVSPDGSEKKNILIIVFDAFSARHISTYGYERETTPNITRLAGRSVVFHNHHAAGNFTTPGTGSLMTGFLPWRHRAFALYSPVLESLAGKSIFHSFQDYHRIAYSHNPAAVTLLNQFSSGLDTIIPLEKFLLNSDELLKKFFPNDTETALAAWARAIKKIDSSSYSLFMSLLLDRYQEKKFTPYRELFPRGLPSIYEDNYFTLEMVIDWLGSRAANFPRPFFGYFHFIPPHDPYSARADFVNVFLNDGFRPVEKADDLFYTGPPPDKMPEWRQRYDEYILYVDSEFGRLFDRLEASGALENTWVILTSDHGEHLERGIAGHLTPVLYEPVIHIPLLIFEPGRSSRTDIYTPTSAVDLLPTLLHLAGKPIPNGLEGQILPSFSDAPLTPGRNVYTVQSWHTTANEPLTEVTLSQIKGDYKLMYFTGYEELQGRERVELYNLAEDPEELNNLYSDPASPGKALLEELKAKLSEVNEPYLQPLK